MGKSNANKAKSVTIKTNNTSGKVIVTKRLNSPKCKTKIVKRTRATISLSDNMATSSHTNSPIPSAVSPRINDDKIDSSLNKRNKTSHDDSNQKSCNVNPNIPVSNPFGLLNIITETDMDTSPSTNNAPQGQQIQHQNVKPKQTSAKNLRPPPIIITSKIENYKIFHQHTSSICNNVRIQYLPKEVKIYASTLDEHYKLFNEFKKQNVQCYTFTPKQERTNKIVVKAAPFYTGEEKKNHLVESGLQVSDCVKLKTSNKLNERTAHSFLCTALKSTPINELKKISSIENTKLQ